MKLAARLFAIVIAAALVSSAALANAGHRTGTALDEPGHVRSTPAPARAAAPAQAPHATEDDAPRLRPCPPAHATGSGSATVHIEATPAPAPARSTLPASGDHRSDKRERGRTTPTNTAQIHRPATHRVKGPVRTTPATPGMGLLLRFGTNAGREISMNSDDAHTLPSSLRAGRAPPRAGPFSNPAPAALPRTLHLANPARAHRPNPTAGDSVTGPDFLDDRDVLCDRIQATTPATDAAPASMAFPAERHTGFSLEPRAARWKGAFACLTPPFGGRNA